MSDDLHTAAKDLLAARRSDEVYRIAVDVLNEITNGDECTVATPVDGELLSRASVSTGLLVIPDESPLTDRNGIIQHSFEIGNSCLVDDLTDTRSASESATGAEHGRYRSLLCVPLADRGVLVAVAQQPAAFSPADLESVTRMAKLVEAALDRLDSTASRSNQENLREEVVTILSHDSSNPLTVAHAHLEMAREQAPEDDEHFGKLETALDRLDALIDDAVTLLQTGERVTSPTPVPLGKVTEQAWSMVDAPDATLEVRDAATVYADESRLYQLLENLFRNAVDHGGPAVTVYVGLLADDDGFYVEDDGPGIRRDERNDVFDYGYSSTADQTGFGLSIVQWIAEAHGWTVHVSDGTDGGARFEFRAVDVG